MSKRDLYIKAKSSTPATAPVGAKPLKTNQTTSFRTGDDGDDQRGREDDFFTLEDNNPFGNTDRFTAVDGTQTYTDDIILDWSTYNGSKVLGYCTADIATNANWNNQIDNAVAATHGGYNDWRVCNVREFVNICNFGVGNGFSINYAPFSIADNVRITTSTTNNGNTSNAFERLATNQNMNGTSAKTAATARIDVRYFTNAELGI